MRSGGKRGRTWNPSAVESFTLAIGAWDLREWSSPSSSASGLAEEGRRRMQDRAAPRYFQAGQQNRVPPRWFPPHQRDGGQRWSFSKECRIHTRQKLRRSSGVTERRRPGCARQGALPWQNSAHPCRERNRETAGIPLWISWSWIQEAPWPQPRLSSS